MRRCEGHCKAVRSCAGMIGQAHGFLCWHDRARSEGEVGGCRVVLATNAVNMGRKKAARLPAMPGAVLRTGWR